MELTTQELLNQPTSQGGPTFSPNLYTPPVSQPAPAPAVPGTTPTAKPAPSITEPGVNIEPPTTTGYNPITGQPSVLPQTSLTGLSENAQRLQAYQSKLDAIRETYRQKIDEYKSNVGEATARSSAAASALMGLAGSTSAESMGQKAGATTAKGVKQLEARRDVELAKASNQISQVKKDYDKAVSEASTEEATLRQGEAQDALTKVSSLLPGVPYSKFKKNAPGTYKQLLEIMGGNDAGLELLWNNAMKSHSPTKASDYKFIESPDGTKQAFQYDPSTGELKRRTDLDVTAPEKAEGSGTSSKPWSPDGGKTWYAIPLDAKGRSLFPEDGNLNPYKMNVAGKTTAPKAQNPEKQAESDMLKQISSLLSQGGTRTGIYLSPDEYNKAKRAWVIGGYSATSFDTKFKGYKDPNQEY